MINGILSPKQIWLVVGGFLYNSLDSLAIGSHIDVSKENVHELTYLQ